MIHLVAHRGIQTDLNVLAQYDAVVLAANAERLRCVTWTDNYTEGGNEIGHAFVVHELPCVKGLPIPDGMTFAGRQYDGSARQVIHVVPIQTSQIEALKSVYAMFLGPGGKPRKPMRPELRQLVRNRIAKYFRQPPAVPGEN